MAEALPHPRDVFDLIGHEAPEAAFEDARSRGRLHHAWLLTGPEGVGKATFAFRAARRLLGAPADPRFGVLGSSPEHSVSRLVMARSHPDLLVIERVGEDGKARKTIPVDEARKLSEFFSKSPASAPPATRVTRKAAKPATQGIHEGNDREGRPSVVMTPS